MKKLADFLYAIMAGAFISMGGVVFLSLDNKIVGAFMFSLGLFAVCTLKYNLFTGKVGYLFCNDVKTYLPWCLMVWLSLIHISEPTRREWLSRMPSSA